MIVTSFKGRKVALFGLGGSGLATAEALAAGGAEVTAWDDNPDSVQKKYYWQNNLPVTNAGIR
jgi:UDP-N-acetylmuramoylalanine--D-glutamate ligase